MIDTVNFESSYKKDQRFSNTTGFQEFDIRDMDLQDKSNWCSTCTENMKCKNHPLLRLPCLYKKDFELV